MGKLLIHSPEDCEDNNVQNSVLHLFLWGRPAFLPFFQLQFIAVDNNTAACFSTTIVHAQEDCCKHAVLSLGTVEFVKLQN